MSACLFRASSRIASIARVTLAALLLSLRSRVRKKFRKFSRSMRPSPFTSNLPASQPASPNVAKGGMVCHRQANILMMHVSDFLFAKWSVLLATPALFFSFLCFALLLTWFLTITLTFQLNSCGRFSIYPQRHSGQAVDAGCLPVSPPGTCLHFFRASSSVCPLLVHCSSMFIECY